MQYIFIHISLGLITRMQHLLPTLLLICCCDFGDKSFPRCSLSLSLSHATPDAAASLLIPSHPHLELPPSIATLLPHFLKHAAGGVLGWKTLIYLWDVSMVHDKVNAILWNVQNLQICKDNLDIFAFGGQIGLKNVVYS